MKRRCSVSADHSSGETLLNRRDLDEIGAGVGVPTECERCGKSGVPCQQFKHIGVTVCFVWPHERSEELVTEGN